MVAARWPRSLDAGVSPQHCRHDLATPRRTAVPAAQDSAAGAAQAIGAFAASWRRQGLPHQRTGALP